MLGKEQKDSSSVLRPNQEEPEPIVSVDTNIGIQYYIHRNRDLDEYLVFF